ncbi:hypothetical protein BT96DRAFT_998647 [Gymnopus androsaceus JB14]|uniref:F-box domain-containing protein n=1 Tax=Gymnopus androsaceus JB14 TaxID=1447944 RepID=A0A6A4HAK1_9AGAR|nr:hypothetical protein BT96DRAFT_998647 [Gymnopus androsaceus JB14]
MRESSQPRGLCTSINIYARIRAHLMFLPNLKSLRVPCLDLINNSRASLLSCLKTPLLEDLTLHWVCKQSVFGFRCTFRDVIGLQRHSGITNLCSLTLDGIDVGGHDIAFFLNDLIVTLAVFPTIKSFRIHRRHDVLLPKLGNFELVPDTKKPTSLNLTPMIFSRMVLSRWWSKETDSQTGIGQSSNRNGLVTLQTVTVWGIPFKQDVHITSILNLPGLVVNIK